MLDGLALPGEMAGTDDAHALVADLGDDAFAGDVADLGRLRQHDVPRLRLGNDPVGDRVLGLAFGCGREGQLVIDLALAEQHDVADPEAALGQGARLVEDSSIEIARAFEGGAVADQQAIAGAERGTDGDNERDGQAERMRAGHDHHRDHPLEREFERGGQEEPPDEERSEADDEGDVGQPGRSPVGDVLRARACRLGLLHEIDELSEIGRVARRGHLDRHRVGAVDRATDRRRADRLGDGPGLARKHGLVEA